MKLPPAVMDATEAEDALIEEVYQRLAEAIAPSNDQLRALAGTFSAPPGAFDHEEMPY